MAGGASAEKKKKLFSFPMTSNRSHPNNVTKQY